MKFQIVTEIELEQDELDLLQKINTCGYVEYKDTEWESIHEFKLYNDEDFRTPEWYLKRNFNGTLLTAYKLARKKLLKSDGASWHLTYKVSELGRSLLEQNISC